MRHHCCPQGKEHPPILLVDGYNVLFKFVESLQLSRSSHPIAIAKTFDDRRQAFELSINAYSHTQGVKVVIAYDAINRLADPVYVDIRTSSRYVQRSVQPIGSLQVVGDNTFVLQTAVHPPALPLSLCKCNTQVKMQVVAQQAFLTTI